MSAITSIEIPSPLIPSSGRMYPDVVQKISEFLTAKEILESYIRINCLYRNTIESRGLPQKELTIPSQLVHHVLTENTNKFMHVETIHITGTRFEPLNLPAAPNLAPRNRISRLSIEGHAPNSYLSQVFESIPIVRWLNLENRSVTSGFQLKSPLLLESSLTPLARAHLNQLAELSLIDGLFRKRPILEILQSTENLTSVRFYRQSLANPILASLASKVALKNLVFKGCYNPELNFEILAGCHCLERFTPNETTSSAELISITRSNLTLTDLSLIEMEENLTAEVFEVIATTLPNLKSLKIFLGRRDPSFASVGFASIMHRCSKLQTLYLRVKEGYSLASLSELRYSSKLKSLLLNGVSFDDAFMNILSMMTELTSLKLIHCNGFSSESVKGLTKLVNLKSIVLPRETLTADLVSEFRQKCPHLESWDPPLP